MGWVDAVLNARANSDAAHAVTLTLHDGDPGATGANQVVTAPITWSEGGAEGPLPTLQPATPGISHAAPSPAVPAGTLTHYGFRDSYGAWLGGFPLSPHVETVTLGPRQFLVRTGPNV